MACVFVGWPVGGTQATSHQTRRYRFCTLEGQRWALTCGVSTLFVVINVLAQLVTLHPPSKQNIDKQPGFELSFVATRIRAVR